MNKSTKCLFTISALSVLSITVGIGIAANNNQSNLNYGELPNIRYAQSKINFDNADITRRVYFFIDGEWDEWKNVSYVLHYTLDGNNWNWSSDAQVFYGDFYQGLYYVDIQGEGVGKAFTAQVKAGGGDQNQKYTVNVNLPSLADKTYDVIHIESGSDSGQGYKRVASISQAGASEINKIASFLNFMRPCDDSFANGYNAYPQFKANFLDPENAAQAIANSGDTETVSDKDEHNVNYTVNQKIAELNYRYGLNGWFVE